MSFLESLHSLISHEGDDEEEVAGSSVRGHRTDGGLSDSCQVGLGSNRLHTHTHMSIQTGQREDINTPGGLQCLFI